MIKYARIETSMGMLQVRESEHDSSQYPGVAVELVRNGKAYEIALLEVDESGEEPLLKAHVYDTVHEEPVFDYSVGAESLDKSLWYSEDKHFAEIAIPKADAETINHLLKTEPANEDDCYGENEHNFDYECAFDNGYRMAVMLCGVQYNPGECNTPWTQAVLYDSAGCERACSGVEEEFLGEWELECEGEIYAVNVLQGE